MADLPLTLADAAAGLRSRAFSSVELTTALRARADEFDSVLGSYVARFDESALRAAAQADADFASGIDRGPLQGIPIGVKDLLAASEGPTTANSIVLDPAWGAGTDAPVVRRLRHAGAVLTGKTSTYEFAMSPPHPSSPFPTARNPWDLSRSPGGSSSGSASGVAAGFFLAALGTDTGGSIRGPAAWTGITGLKPTFGLVPKSGCVPLAQSLDHVGPMAPSAQDCALVLQVIAGHHASDESSARRPVDRFAVDPHRDLTGMRIGVVREHHFPENSDPAAEPAYRDALARLEERGAVLVDVALPRYREAVASVWIMVSGDALAYHLDDLRSRWDDFLPTTRLNVATGALISGADMVQAARARRIAQLELADLFRHVDIIATPTATIPAAPLADLMVPGIERGLGGGVFTPYWNAVGVPTIAVPMGANAEGLPLSIQLAAPAFADRLLLDVAAAYQRDTDWHLRRPEFGDSGVGASGPAPTRDLADLQQVRTLLAASGIHPPEDDIETLADAYAPRREMVEWLYALAEARYGTTSLINEVAPERVSWSDPEGDER
ncbi:Asp-tRNA(Asn)/Glu-tRNA(Gln) amidotransferase subunit GatA [Microbacterium aoyamense]|uniref:Asp-tRNA(Asn)/Glu-tRNA(Gln) amidotransferase subunit GatA n=2 Tax=Microbacterium aoyamense TaxID=344166 RepID=A0ABP5AVR5_9MICO